jgi:AcrR family transcriptional regulator
VTDADVAVTELILRAASRTVALHGVKRASVASIALEAGVARSTVYRAFDSKEEILSRMIEYEFGRFFNELYNAVGKLRTLDDVMEHGLMFAHAAVEHHFLLQAILRDDPSVLEPALTASSQAIEPVIAGIFAPFLPEGEHREEHATFLASLGLSYIATQGRWNFERRRDVKDVVSVELLAGVHGPEMSFSPATVAPLVPMNDASLRTQVINATLDEIAAGHYRDISIDRVVDKVQGSRATIYRLVPGGNQSLLDLCAEREASRVYAAVVAAMSSESDLHRGLLAGLTTIWSHLATHAALKVVVTENPEFLWRRLRFSEAARTYSAASAVVEPLLRRWLPSAQANRVAEWLIRIVVVYWNAESPYVDVRDPASVARFYGRHMAPGVEKILSSVTA